MDSIRRAIPEKQLLALLAAMAIAAVSTHADPAGAEPLVYISSDCFPDPIRPNEATVVRCEFEVWNEGDTTVPEARLSITAGGTGSGSLEFFILGDHQSRFIGPMAELGTLAPGERKTASFAFILKAEGTLDTRVTVHEPKGPQRAAAVGEFDVRPDAPHPQRDLRISLTLDEPVSWQNPNDTPEADIAITLRNDSTRPIRDVIIRDEITGSATTRWETPPARTQEAATEWDVSLLAPGEELVLRGHIAKDRGCLEVEHGVVATGTMDGGAQLESADLGRWSHGMCECPMVDCIAPPTPAPTSTATSTPSTMLAPAAAPVSVNPGQSGGTPWWPWIGLGGGLAFAVVAGAVVRRIRR